VLEDPEGRSVVVLSLRIICSSRFTVHDHVASALINFCEGVERDTLLPYLDPIVERLLKLLIPADNLRLVWHYVQEQAITTLVADASEVTFTKVSKCPLLSNLLWNTHGPDYRKSGVKAMECAGLIGAPCVVFVLSNIDLRLILGSLSNRRWPGLILP